MRRRGPPARGLPGATGPPGRTPPFWRRAGRPVPPGASGGSALAGLSASGGPASQPGEHGSVSGYLERPAAPPSPVAFLGWPGQALAAPAGCSCGGVGYPAAFRAANKAGPRRKRLARGLPFTRVEIN